MDLSFLKGKSNLYYAGLDDRGLPFGKSLRLIKQFSEKSITYIKAISLFVDHIIIPPTFFFYYMPSDKKTAWHLFREFLPLFADKHLVTSVYGNVNKTSDFLELKMEKGDPEEINFIMQNMATLKFFFNNIPLFRRDVEIQSSAFKQTFIASIRDAPSSTLDQKAKESLLAPIENSGKVGDIALSRYKTILLINDLKQKGVINDNMYGEIYYRMNSSYYKEGSETYYANVSCLNSPDYSILIKNSPKTEFGKILIAYDPELILSILRSHGINEDHINELTAFDIEKIKESNTFKIFKDRYQCFSEDLQNCLNDVDKISKDSLMELIRKILEQFQQEYLIGQRFAGKIKFRYSILESAFFSTATGILGYCLGGILGAMLGGVPVILQASGITPRISDYIIEKIGNNEKAFYEYVEFIRKVSSDLEKERRSK